MPRPSYRREYGYYCPKCGMVRFLTVDSDEICDICGTKTQETPHEYGLTYEYWSQSKDGFNQAEQRFIDEVVSRLPGFDPELHRDRFDILERKWQEKSDALDRVSAFVKSLGKGVTCSYCGSTNVKKIGFLSRAMSAELWGLGSSKIGKQWHCNSCGSDF